MPVDVTLTAPSTRGLLGTLAVTGALAGGVAGALAAGQLSESGPAPAAARARDVPPAAAVLAERGPRPMPLPARTSPVRHHRVHRAVKHTTKRRVSTAAPAVRVEATVTTTPAPIAAPAAADVQAAAPPVVRTKPVAKPVTPSPRASTPRPQPAPSKPRPQPDPAPPGTFDDSG